MSETMLSLAIRPVTQADAPAIAEIYNHYVRETTVTFEEEPVTDAAMASRLAAASPIHPWLVGEADGAIIGYAYARKYHERAAYRHTVETAVYLDHCRQGMGAGTALYGALLAALPRGRVHALIGSVALPNPASLRLHEKFDFDRAAEYPQIGFKFGRWIDVVCFHRLLDAPRRKPG
jgi:L-amino acid N-acyltransferase YncA